MTSTNEAICNQAEVPTSTKQTTGKKINIEVSLLPSRTHRKESYLQPFSQRICFFRNLTFYIYELETRRIVPIGAYLL